MKWIAIILGVGLLIGAFYMVMSKGGALEMQPEHAVEAPAHSAPTATVSAPTATAAPAAATK